MLSIELTNEHATLPVDEERLKSAVRQVLDEAKITRGLVSIAVVDDPTIHALNAEFLQHDYATDVLSFVFEAGDGQLDGEIIVSSDTAIRSAAQFGWQAEDELLLYTIHGCLHLVGHDDQDADSLAEMRAAEVRHLARFGVSPRYEESL